MTLMSEPVEDLEGLSLSGGQALSWKESEKKGTAGFYFQEIVADNTNMDDFFATILEKLPGNSLFIYIQEFHGHAFFFVVERGGIHKFIGEKEFLLCGEQLLYNLGLQRWVAGKTDLTGVTEKFNILSRQWSKTVPRDVKQLIKDNENVILSPGLNCTHLPLEALQFNGEPLCVEKTVVRATSLRQFLTLSKRDLSFDSSLVVGNPWPHYGEKEFVYALPSNSERFKLSYLKGAEEEAQALVERLPNATMLLEQNATGQKFLSEISQHSLIHFSGHGSLGSILFLSGPFKGFPFFENEEFSDMQRAERFEGFQKINMMEEWHPVTDLDLFDIPLTEGAVVFLNACETGQHKYAGEYFRGFPAVFLKNGAHSVISSLVPIFDEYSKEFALSFYDILLKTHSVTKSLKKAREWIKDIYRAPIYWVPYIHYGVPL